MSNCILCGGGCVTNRQDYASRTIYNCQNCGVFVISDPVEQDVLANRNKIAAFLVNRHLTGNNDIVLISLENVSRDKGYVHMNVDQIVRAFPDSMMRKMNLALRNLIQKSEYPGAEVRIESLSQGPIFYLEHVNFESMSFAISSLEQKGFIRVNYYGSSFFPCNIIVTTDGWEEAARATYDKERQDTAMIALAGSGAYASEYVKAVTKALRSNGYRVVEYPLYSGEVKVGHSLMARLREIRFLVADISDAAPETYFSAGMAGALDKPLIVTCRKRDRKNIRVEQEQLSVLIWENADELTELVSNAVRALVF